MTKGSGKFGWCLTGQHTSCPKKTLSVACTCECHNKTVESK